MFPSGGPGGEPLDFYEAVVHATHDTLPLVRELRPDVVVADILTLAPALAAELNGIPRATLDPSCLPRARAGLPDLLARRAPAAHGRSAAPSGGAPGADPPRSRARPGRAQPTRARLGLPPLQHGHGGISRELALVATFPQLEYPRAWPSWAHVVGPLMWEPPARDVELPPGDDPLVLIAPSTAQDPDHRLLHAALRGLADAPVRVLATWNRRLPSRPLPVPANARVVEWVSYARTMPLCDVVVCHAGHGTLVRALACGCAVVACPRRGRHERERRAPGLGRRGRARFRGASSRRARCGWRSSGRSSEPAIRARARELAAWADTHDPEDTAAALVEQLAGCTPIELVGPASHAPVSITRGGTDR